MNTQAAKQLRDYYRSINEETISSVLREGESLEKLSGALIMGRLTKFGEFKCILCTSAMEEAGLLYPAAYCSYCIYSTLMIEDRMCIFCTTDPLHESYYKISHAKTSCELIEAVRTRADIIDNIITELEKNT